jgi:hypothetical protein
MTPQQAEASRQESSYAMSLPIHESALQPAPARPAGPEFRLWRDALAWRNLVIAAIGISAALLALPLIETSADRAQTEATACQAKPFPFSHPPQQGQVVGFLTPEQADDVLQRTQRQLGMTINPDYLPNARSYVHLDGGVQGSRYVYLVPQGMNVRVGDRVEIIGGRLDPNLPCAYIPNLITRDLSQ